MVLTREAMRELLSGSREHPTTNSVLKQGVDSFWRGIYHKPWLTLHEEDPSDFWTFDWADNPDDSDGSFMLDRGRENVTVTSKKRYPQVLLRTKLPELKDGQRVWMGLQNSGNGKTGVLLLRYSMSGGNYALHVAWGTGFGFQLYDVTDALPTDARTAINEYMFQLNGPFAEVYVNDELVFVGMNSPHLTSLP